MLSYHHSCRGRERGETSRYFVAEAEGSAYGTCLVKCFFFFFIIHLFIYILFIHLSLFYSFTYFIYSFIYYLFTFTFLLPFLAILKFSTPLLSLDCLPHYHYHYIIIIHPQQTIIIIFIFITPFSSAKPPITYRLSLSLIILQAPLSPPLPLSQPVFFIVIHIIHNHYRYSHHN